MRLISTASSILALAALLLASITWGAEAQEDEVLHFTGIVLAVDTSRDVLTVEQASEDAKKEHFLVSDGTEVTKNGEQIALSGIGVGDPVNVVYHTAASGNEARSVEVITSPTT